MSEEDVYVHVLCDFTYSDKEGKEVKIKKDEELLVVQKSNKTWWQVIRDTEKCPFFVPSCYLKTIDNSINGNAESKDVNANIELDDDATSEGKSENGTANYKEKSEVKWSSFKSKNLLWNYEQDKKSNGPEPVKQSNSSNHHDAAYIEELEKSMKESLSLDDDSMPIYANIPLATNLVPPCPAPDDAPQRTLFNNWNEYIDENGRKYYHHIPSNKVTWKPPRRSDSMSSFDENTDRNSLSDKQSMEEVPKPPPKKLKPKLQKLAHSSSESLDSPSSPCMFTILPPGWTQESDTSGGPVYYCHEASKKRWYSSQDENGRTYFYDEDTAESFWELPVITPSGTPECKQDSASHDIQHPAPASKFDVGSLSDMSPKMRSKKIPKLPVPRQFKARSMVVTESINLSNNNSEEEKTMSPCSLGCTIHSGILNKTKLVEGGRRVRKSWSSCYILLTDMYLLFYKDARSASSSLNAKPEFSIDLNGALMDWCPDKSSRKNVLQISTITGHQLLLQHDDAKEMKDWFSYIQEAIIKLPSSLENIGMKSEERQEIKLSRSRSTKQCHCNKGSSEDVNETIPADKKRKIRDKLRHFFVRRPTMESLREKGIILDEPVFGCRLENLCHREGHSVPRFVMRCIETIERKELTADGIYRASGNLSQVQKIRFHVNQDDYKCLDQEDDVHVLTGALKMFFREMKAPLFPFQTFNNFLHAISSPDTQSKLKALKELVKNMPEPNYETLKFLLCHLLRVTEFHKQNRMQVQNLAIVFGPTLMWPEEESANIALDMMYQNRIVEFLLLEFHAIFN